MLETKESAYFLPCILHSIRWFSHSHFIERYNQIGRTGPLTPNKTSHFRLLYEESDVPYHEMLFFDVRLFIS